MNTTHTYSNVILTDTQTHKDETRHFFTDIVSCEVEIFFVPREEQLLKRKF